MPAEDLSGFNIVYPMQEECQRKTFLSFTTKYFVVSGTLTSDVTFAFYQHIPHNNITVFTYDPVRIFIQTTFCVIHWELVTTFCMDHLYLIPVLHHSHCCALHIQQAMISAEVVGKASMRKKVKVMYSSFNHCLVMQLWALISASFPKAAASMMNTLTGSRGTLGYHPELCRMFLAWSKFSVKTIHEWISNNYTLFFTMHLFLDSSESLSLSM